jgi:transcriptional regulator of acetoin/glycerol metabolism
MSEWTRRVREAQRAILEEALRACDWNVSQTAKALSVHRGQLYKLIHRYGLERPPDAQYTCRPHRAWESLGN